MFWKPNLDHKASYLKLTGRDTLEACCVLIYAVKMLVLINFPLEMLAGEEIKICDVWLITIWIIQGNINYPFFRTVLGKKHKINTTYPTEFQK